MRTVMKFKLDGNLGTRAVSLFAGAGYDVSTVMAQDLQGSSDEVLIEVCRVEERCLVTLDLDFSNPIRFAPARYAGIVVLRPPGNATFSDILDCIRILLRGLITIQSIKGKLWTVSPKQIREYDPPDSH